MSIPKPGDYGWGKNAQGSIALGPVKANVKIPAGWFKKKTIPLAICDGNAGRIMDVDYLVEWHPLGDVSTSPVRGSWNPRTSGQSSHPEY